KVNFKTTRIGQLTKETKKALGKQRKSLCDYVNRLLVLIRIEDRLTSCENETETKDLENHRDYFQEILDQTSEDYKKALNLSKNGENYRQIITDTISQLEEKIKGHSEEAEREDEETFNEESTREESEAEVETESPLTEEDLGHESTAEVKRVDFTFKTDNGFF